VKLDKLKVLGLDSCCSLMEILHFADKPTVPIIGWNLGMEHLDDEEKMLMQYINKNRIMNGMEEIELAAAFARMS